MAISSRSFSTGRCTLFLFSVQAMMLVSSVHSDLSDILFLRRFSKSKTEKDVEEYAQAQNCSNCESEQGVDITVMYTDPSGKIKTFEVNSRELSSSWIWQNSLSTNHAQKVVRQHEASNEQLVNRTQENVLNGPQGSTKSSRDQNQEEMNEFDPAKLKRQYLRQKRKEKRTAELIHMSRDTELRMRNAAIERTKHFVNKVKDRYSIWRIEYRNPQSDSTLKLMKDQIIMAKIYASIARSKKDFNLYDSLMRHIKESRGIITDANSDNELHTSALEQAKAMGRALSMAKDVLLDYNELARKLRAMLQSTEENINSVKKQNTFLVQHAAKTIPKPLHCLPLQLTTDYFLHNHARNEMLDKYKLEDNSLYHYAIFSDNVLATAVVVNSTVINAKEPEKHVFHVVTDKLNFAAMRMWFIIHPPRPSAIHVQNIDEFKWLNSSYCSVLRQLESARIKEYYFKASHPSSLSVGNENLKYRNPKYLSMLNHLRFYMPEVYPKLDKLLFLDDDIVVQKDLTKLWTVDMKGMVNGAVETCKESFHRFDTYLNFSNPKIAENFDPRACGWAFGMNVFDLKEWKKQSITGLYHYWQDLNEDRKLWKLGTLPPGLITFYNLTYPLDRSWHVLGLGYDPAVDLAQIKNAAVIHYNGNYKPWLDLAITKYNSYWSKYVNFDNPYIQSCYMNK
ncbi:probable galacturonosyltransferase 3 isoform X1 [Ananas comosus]|uniref:Hexosyltransferase n=1 Tax=Ananas comosus TaxID=4615 RepID=A0A6P5H8U2_ANACO|nr:probable galacturonosyltransferase 3 isoform X1 [Ananas comosus]